MKKLLLKLSSMLIVVSAVFPVISCKNPENNIIMTLINLKKSNVELNQDTSTIDSVINFSELQSLKINKDKLNTSIASVTMGSNGQITITGKSKGTTSIEITADNAAAKILKIIVDSSLININLNQSNLVITTGFAFNIKIINYLKLIGIVVSSDNIAQTKYYVNNGEIAIKGMNAGVTKISVSAKNAASQVFINVKVENPHPVGMFA